MDKCTKKNIFLMVILRYITKRMAKKRFSTQFWCMLSELTLGIAKKWDNYLHILEHSYNKATHSSTGFSPFEVFLGFQLASPTDLPLDWAPQGTFHQQQEQLSPQRFLQQIAQRHSVVTSSLKATQDHAKKHHDKERTFMAFQRGEQVSLHLHKKRFKGHQQSSANQILSVYNTHKIGENAYRLDMPPQMGIHNVINVNNLKLFEPSLLEELVTITHQVDKIIDFQLPLAK
jgi:hypothetical protein